MTPQPWWMTYMRWFSRGLEDEKSVRDASSPVLQFMSKHLIFT